MADSDTKESPTESQGPVQTESNYATQLTPLKHKKWRYVLVVASGFLVMFTTCALIFTFGVWQSLYEEMAAQPNTPFTGTSTAEINLIGTLAIALMSMGGPFTMIWAKLYSPQAVIVAGGWIFGIAFILASFSKELWHFTLTQGVLVGVGSCMSYVPTMAVAPTWFDKRRGLAMGVIISGTGVGGMVWPPILHAIIDSIGFRNALRIAGCLLLALVSLAGSALAWEPDFQTQVDAQTRDMNRVYGWLKIPLVDWKLAKTTRFAAQASGCFLQSAGYSVPLFFYAAYARSLGYSNGTATNFITVSNASNFVSRIVIGWGADRWGRINALAFTTLFSTVAVFGFWLPSMFGGSTISSTSAEGLFIAFTVLYGSFASAYISLFPASLIELFGVQNFTSVNGALYLIRGIGALIGTPLIGLLIPQSAALTSSMIYERAGITVGVLLFAATVACVVVRIEAMAGSPWRWKI